MKKALALWAFTLGLALLAAGCSRTTTIAPRADELNTSVPPLVSTGDGNNFSDSLFSFSFRVGDELISLPIQYKELIQRGWSCDILPTEHLLGNTMVSNVVFTKGELAFTCDLANQTQRLAAAPETDVILVFLDGLAPGGGYTLPKKITVGQATAKEVEEAYGTPNDIYDSVKRKNTSVWSYEYDRNEFIQFAISNDTNVLEAAVIYRALDAPPYTKAPDMIENYTPASAMSDSLASQIFTLDGAVYKMPVPVAQFLQNGWELDYADAPQETAARDTILESNTAEQFVLTKGEQALSVVVCNFALEERAASEGYVVDLFLYAQAARDVSVSPDMTFLTTKAEVEALCAPYPYCYKEDNGLDIYWIYISDYGYVSPVFDHATQQIAYFQLFCVP